MKIIDETGAVVGNPDLTLGYLTADTEEITHPAVEGVEEQWHWETVTEYPNGGKDVQRVVDVLCVQAQEEFNDTATTEIYTLSLHDALPISREKLPETVAALQKENETLKKESEMLKQCLLEMSEIVYA